MMSQQPPGQLHEGRNYPSPVQKILALGYYDGPTEGVLLSAPDRVYQFLYVATPLRLEGGVGSPIVPLAIV